MAQAKSKVMGGQGVAQTAEVCHWDGHKEPCAGKCKGEGNCLQPAVPPCHATSCTVMCCSCMGGCAWAPHGTLRRKVVLPATGRQSTLPPLV